MQLSLSDIIFTTPCKYASATTLYNSMSTKYEFPQTMYYFDKNKLKKLLE